VDRILAIPGLNDKDRMAIFNGTLTHLLKIKV
jgi:hypothetical protein